MKSLTINIFFRCNARCKFCVAGLTGGGTARKEFSVHEVKEELKKGYQRGCRLLTFSGGEPTIYRELPEAARYAKELGYRRIELKTNGLKLASRRFTKELIEAGVDLFSISIHGPAAEVHDELVGVPRAFERALKGADNVKEQNAGLSLPTCIQQGNFNRLPETVRLLNSLQPEFMLPTFIEPSGSAAFHFDEVVPKYSEVDPYLREACQILRRQTKSLWALHGFPMCQLDGNEDHSYDLVRKEEFLGGTEESDYYGYEQTVYRAKAAKCQVCHFNGVCGGPWRTYVEHHGWDEFQPIRDKNPSNVIPLAKLAKAVFARDPLIQDSAAN